MKVSIVLALIMTMYEDSQIIEKTTNTNVKIYRGQTGSVLRETWYDNGKICERTYYENGKNI